MFAATKLQALLQIKGPVENFKHFPNLVSKYHEAINPGPIYHPKQIINSYLHTINDLKSYLINLKPLYLRGNRDYTILQKLLVGARTPSNLQRGNTVNANTVSSYLLFHLLIGVKIHSNKIVTFSHWDKLVVHSILAWCYYQNCQINAKTLFHLLDMVNGDQPYQKVSESISISE